MNQYKVTVVFPVYVTVSAANAEEAEIKALEQTEEALKKNELELEPIIHDLEIIKEEK